jgi:hypothetical protein
MKLNESEKNQVKGWSKTNNDKELITQIKKWRESNKKKKERKKEGKKKKR